MDTLILMLQLFTSLPINKSVEVSDERLIRGVALWPAAGIVIALFEALIFWAAMHILPLSAAAALALLGELWMTRGFHLDGLCDTADALFSSRSRERMLEIMKDSHIGTFGVVAAIADLAFKYLLLTASAMPLFLILAAPVAGKMVQSLCMYRAVYPRESGLGKSYIGRIPLHIAIISALFGALWVGACLGIGIICTGIGCRTAIGIPVLFGVVGLCFILAWLFRRHMEKAIGGMTGDTLGAASEIIEIFYMLLVVALEGVL